ncbi:MAG: type II toxin-antitoxin system VapC family toxin [Candidatus Bathyarchaeia archaeon]
MKFLNVKVYAVMEVLTIRGSEKEIFETASKESLTVYDASYFYMAVRNGLILVTDDHKLKENGVKIRRNAWQ